MATTQISAAKQLAISLKAAAKLILVKDRENIKLGQQLDKAKARLEAAKGGASAPVVKRGPKAKAEVAEQPVKATRAKKVAVVEQEQPKKRGPKAGVKAAVVEAKVPAKRGPKPGAKKAAVEVVKGKTAKAVKPVKKAKSGNDDFLLP